MLDFIIDKWILSGFRDPESVADYLYKHRDVSGNNKDKMLDYIFRDDNVSCTSRRNIAVLLFEVCPERFKDILAYVCFTDTYSYSLDNSSDLKYILDFIYCNRFPVDFIDRLLEIENISDLKRIISKSYIDINLPIYYIESKINEVMSSDDEELKRYFISLAYSSRYGINCCNKILDCIFKNNDINSLAILFNKITSWLYQYSFYTSYINCESERIKNICNFVSDYFKMLLNKVGDDKDFIIKLIIDNLYFFSFINSSFINDSLGKDITSFINKFINDLDDESKNYLKDKLYFLYSSDFNQIAQLCYETENFLYVPDSLSDKLYSIFDKYIDNDDTFIKLYFLNIFRNMKGKKGSISFYSRCLNRLLIIKYEFLRNIDFINSSMEIFSDSSSFDLDKLFAYLDDFINDNKIKELFNILSKYKFILNLYLEYLYKNNYVCLKDIIVNRVIDDEDNDILYLLINHGDFSLIIEYCKNYVIKDIDSILSLITSGILDCNDIIYINFIINLILYSEFIDINYMEDIIDRTFISVVSLRDLLFMNREYYGPYIKYIINNSSGFVCDKANHLYKILYDDGYKKSDPTSRTLKDKNCC